MRTRRIKIFIGIIAIVFFSQLVYVPNISLAGGIEDVISQGDDFIAKGKLSIDQSKLNESQSQIFNILLVIGTMLTVSVGGYLGIKFMIASAEEKAQIKETMIPYVVGAGVIFGAFGIWKIVITVLDKIA